MKSGAHPIVSEEQAFHLDDTWSASDFGSEAINSFARSLLVVETQRGLMTLALLSLVTHIIVLVVSNFTDQPPTTQSIMVSTHGALAVLSLHTAVSARWLHEIKVLNLMGMALLVVTGTALMLMAHRTDNVSGTLIVGFAMLFMTLPIMTWGLKQSLLIVALIYLQLTASSMSVSGKFDNTTLLTLQFLILASAAIALIMIARNVGIRKHDIRTRFELDEARKKMERLSNIDPLTCCWNRRYLDQNFAKFSGQAAQQGLEIELVLLDIDLFKNYNDTYGHQVGDQILCTLAENLRQNLPGEAQLIRLGGDEFAVLLCGGGLPEMIAKCTSLMQADECLNKVLNKERVTVSIGVARSSPGCLIDLYDLYHTADKDLYAKKRQLKEPRKSSHRKSVSSLRLQR